MTPTVPAAPAAATTSSVTPDNATPENATPDNATPDNATLAAAVRRLARGSVLVVGDVMLDRYVYGRVERVSPEAPVPILCVDREVALPGGAGNVVRNLTALGVAVAFVAVVGDDQAGSDLTGLIGGQPGVEPWLLVQGSRTTTLKTRYVADGQQMMRADQEDTTPIHPKLAERMLRITRDALAATSVCVLSDYAKGLLDGEVAARIIADAKLAGRRVVVDPQGKEYGRYAGADVVTPNRRELALATGMAVDDPDSLVAAARHLLAAHGFGAVLVTRAEDGMTLVTPGLVRHLPAQAKDVYDASGAGDTVVATLGAALAAGLDLEVAAQLANLAAGIVVGKVGTAVVREGDLLARLSAEGGALRKVVSAEAAAEQVERWRRKGWRAGFTNGCFDPLHPGHVHLLEQARAQCDRLVVGLNSDSSAARLRGGARPTQPEAARAAMLASLSAVDQVVVFEDDTPDALIRLLRPDLLMKGANHALDQIAGADLVRGWGGRVMLAELMPGFGAGTAIPKLVRAAG